MLGQLVFFGRQTLVGTGSALESPIFDISGAGKLEVQFQEWSRTGGGAASTALVAFSPDGITWDQTWALTEQDAPNEISASAMYKFCKVKWTGTNQEVYTFQIIGQALAL